LKSCSQDTSLVGHRSYKPSYNVCHPDRTRFPTPPHRDIDLPFGTRKDGTPLKESTKYSVALLSFIGVASLLSWYCVYSHYFGALVFHSVTAIRFGDLLGSVMLFPSRAFLTFSGSLLEFTNPTLFALINGTLIGVVAYACCRRFIFRKRSGG